MTQRPTTRVEVGEEHARSLLRLIEGLEEHDDVSAVHANFDMPAEILERAAG